MLKIASVVCMVLLATGAHAQTPAVAAPPPAEAAAQRAVQAAELTAANTRSFRLSATEISGPGAEFLTAQTARSQFVLLGEAHFDHDIPIFARGLYAMLARAHGFDRLVVENDPIAMATVDGFGGDLARTADLARRYPTHIGFASDQDLHLYAAAAERSRPGHPALWGIEQAQGAARYLELLEPLAPAGAVREEVSALLAQARTHDTRETMSAFLHDDATMTARLEALATAWAPTAGTEPDRLLNALIHTTVIYGYNRRAGAGERVGLYNNTERETLFRENFLRHYRADAVGDRRPRAMFKMGGWHMYRGKSPGQAYTIANLAHELAYMNGMEAYGISVVSVGGYATALTDLPAWMQPLLPATLPEGPIVLDLRPLKPWAGLFAAMVPEADRWQLRDFIHGHDALVVLPASRKATWDLTGFPEP